MLQYSIQLHFMVLGIKKALLIVSTHEIINKCIQEVKVYFAI